MTVSEQIIKDIKEAIGNTFLSRVEVLHVVESLPDEIYDQEREQYDSNRLVNYIESITKNLKADKIIAIGNMDLFMGDMNFVFGVAQKPGRLCIVPLYRLDQRFYSRPSSYDDLKERAIKESVHELGHCYGLDHCKKSKCVMSYSNNIVAVDNKSRFFCDDCKELLKIAL